MADFINPFNENETSIRERFFRVIEALFPDNPPDLREGSLLWTVTAPLAKEVVEFYTDLNDELSLGFIEYSRGSYLDSKGNELGVPRLSAQPSEGTVRFLGDDGTFIPAGTTVSTSTETNSDILVSFDTLGVDSNGDPLPDSTLTVTGIPNPDFRPQTMILRNLSGTLTGGTFDLIETYYNDTATLPYNATAAQIEAAITANFTDVDTVVVSGGPVNENDVIIERYGPITYPPFLGLEDFTDWYVFRVEDSALTGTGSPQLIVLEQTPRSDGVAEVTPTPQNETQLIIRPFAAPTGGTFALNFGGKNEQQKITATGASGGTFTVSFGASTTSALAYNISSASLKTALEALSGIGAGKLTVTGLDGGPWVVEFSGTGVKLTNQNEFTVNGAGLTGSTPTITVSTIQQGSPGNWTAPIAYNATASAITSALEALPTITTGNVSVQGGPVNLSNVAVTFIGGLSAADQPLMLVDNALATGGGGYDTYVQTEGNSTNSLGSNINGEVSYRYTWITKLGDPDSDGYEYGYGETGSSPVTSPIVLSNQRVSLQIPPPPAYDNLNEVIGVNVYRSFDSGSGLSAPTLVSTADIVNSPKNNAVFNLAGSAAGGTFKIGIYYGDTLYNTVDLAYNATPSEVEIALEAIPVIGPNNVSVTSTMVTYHSPNAAINRDGAFIEFTGNLAGAPITKPVILQAGELGGAGLTGGSYAMFTLVEGGTITVVDNISNADFSIINQTLNDRNRTGYADIPAVATTTGVETNIGPRRIVFLDDTIPVGQVYSVTNPNVFTLGTDDEDDDTYRARLLGAAQTIPGAGTVTDYENWAESVTNVADAIAIPEWEALFKTDLSFNEVTTIALSGTPTSGTFTLTFENVYGVSATTIALPFNASPAAIQIALENLTNIRAGNVVVRTTNVSDPATPISVSPIQIELTNNLGQMEQINLDWTANTASLSPATTATITKTRRGSEGVGLPNGPGTVKVIVEGSSQQVVPFETLERVRQYIAGSVAVKSPYEYLGGYSVPPFTAAQSVSPGGLTTGDEYQYVVSFVDVGGGVTQHSAIKDNGVFDQSLVRTITPTGTSILLSSIPQGPGGVANKNTEKRYIFRRNTDDVINDPRFYLIGVLNDNSTTSFLDTVPDADIDRTLVDNLNRNQITRYAPTINSTSLYDGVSPIGAHVTIDTINPILISVSATIIPEFGYSLSGSNSTVNLTGLITETLTNLFKSIPAGDTIRYIDIENALHDTEGIADFRDVSYTISGETINESTASNLRNYVLRDAVDKAVYSATGVFSEATA